VQSDSSIKPKTPFSFLKKSIFHFKAVQELSFAVTVISLKSQFVSFANQMRNARFSFFKVRSVTIKFKLVQAAKCLLKPFVIASEFILVLWLMGLLH
jgi:hypothetical protein